MKRKYKYKIYLIILIAILCFVIIFISRKYIIVKCDDENYNVLIGIIDGHISKEYNNIFKSNVVKKEKKVCHGDYVLESVFFINNNIHLYYYDAEKNGYINSESLLAGLSWMKDNDVKYVSISLSSKYESRELQKWIDDNSKQMKIYASYNNKENSLDFPAMYDGVIGVGKKQMKDIDKVYNCNELIYLRKDKLLFRKGNSFLTPYAMIEDIKKRGK